MYMAEFYQNRRPGFRSRSLSLPNEIFELRGPRPASQVLRLRYDAKVRHGMVATLRIRDDVVEVVDGGIEVHTLEVTFDDRPPYVFWNSSTSLGWLDEVESHGKCKNKSEGDCLPTAISQIEQQHDSAAVADHSDEGPA